LSAKIKIALIIPSLKAGGSERFISLLANHLDKTQYEVHLLVINGKERFFPINEAVFVYDLEILRVRNALFKIRKTLNIIQPKIIFSTLGYLNLYLAIFRFLLPSNNYFIARESIVLSAALKKTNKIKAYFWKLLYRSFLNNNYIVCQSEDMKASLVNIGLREKNMVIINNPVDSKAIYKKTEVQCDEYYDIITTGRLMPQKGYDRFLQVIVAYKKQLNHPDIKVAIIGEGEERPFLEKEIQRLKLENNVFLLGYQTNPFKYYKNAKLFLLTSYYEGFPNVLLEAGSCGLPIVAFDVPGGIQEIIREGQNGFIITDGAIGKMAKTIEKAMQYDFSRQAISLDTKQRFGISKRIGQYDALFQHLLEEENKNFLKISTN